MCNAQIVSALPTPYCTSMMRSLKAALSLNEQTQALNFTFKKLEDSAPDLCVDVRNLQLLLHEKWMSFDESHAPNSDDCILSHMRHSGINTPLEVFSCDHIIIEMCNQIIQELETWKHSNETPMDESLSTLPVQAGECLKNMLRAIQIGPGPEKGDICVSWEDNEAGRLFRLHKMGLQCRVTLHRESTCHHKRFDLMAKGVSRTNAATNSKANIPIKSGIKLTEYPHEDAEDQMKIEESCGCPAKVVTCTAVDNQVTFSGLSLTESYFPMVSRACTSSALFGLPPTAQKPAQYDSQAVV